MAALSQALQPRRFIQLLADEHRWRILQELARSDRKVSELTSLIGRPQNLVSYHLAGLREAGIVASRRSSADRRDTYYRLDLHRYAHSVCALGPALQPGLRFNIDTPPTAGGVARGRRPSVLFLCTGNRARSQIAEALLEHYSHGAIRARSAGNNPKPVHPNTVRVLAERGIDISGRASKHLDRFRHMRFDRVITLCDRLREVCPEFPGAAATAHWSMPDPTAGEADYEAFVRTADEIESRLPFLIAELALPRERRTNK